MYTIVLKEDKQLFAWNKSTLIEKETNVDMLRFLIPPMYEDIDVSTCVVVVKYTTPDRKNRCERLYPQEELYKGFVDYRLGVDTDITKVPGDVDLRLTFIRINKDSNSVHEQVLHTKEITITVNKLKILYGFNSNESLEIIDQFIAEQNAKIEALNNIATALDNEKADDIEIIDGEIWLTANGDKIGDPIPNGTSGGDNQWDEL